MRLSKINKLTENDNDDDADAELGSIDAGVECPLSLTSKHAETPPSPAEAIASVMPLPSPRRYRALQRPREQTLRKAARRWVLQRRAHGLHALRKAEEHARHTKQFLSELSRHQIIENELLPLLVFWRTDLDYTTKFGPRSQQIAFCAIPVSTELLDSFAASCIMVLADPTMFSWLNLHWKLAIYPLLGLAFMISPLLQSFLASSFACTFDHSNHPILLTHVRSSTRSFFQTVPRERIFNRFSGEQLRILFVQRIITSVRFTVVVNRFFFQTDRIFHYTTTSRPITLFPSVPFSSVSSYSFCCYSEEDERAKENWRVSYERARCGKRRVSRKPTN
jgi:hypothetical protein